MLVFIIQSNDYYGCTFHVYVRVFSLGILVIMIVIVFGIFLRGKVSVPELWWPWSVGALAGATALLSYVSVTSLLRSYAERSTECVFADRSTMSSLFSMRSGASSIATSPCSVVPVMIGGNASGCVVRVVVHPAIKRARKAITIITK